MDNIPTYPGTPFNVNTSNVASLSEAKDFLYLLNPGSYNTKEAFLNAIQNTNYDIAIIDFFFSEIDELTPTDVASLKIKANSFFSTYIKKSDKNIDFP